MINLAQKVAVIVNPVSAHGRTRRRWPKIERAIREVLDEFSVFMTERPDHATALTRKALRDGYDRIVSVGGDGTHHEVLNGFFDGYLPVNPSASMAIVPHGTGSDLARALGLRRSRDAINLIHRGHSIKVDIGRVTFTRPGGNQDVRYFINTADFGIGGAVSKRVTYSKKHLGPMIAYTWGTVAALWGYQPQRMRLQIGGEVIEDEFLDVVVANGQYFGGGMHVAPGAVMDDGFFEVITIPKLSFWQALPKLPCLLNGTYIDKVQDVHTYRATRVVAQCEGNVIVNLDGETPGELPVAVELLPSALRLVIGVRDNMLPIEVDPESELGEAASDSPLPDPSKDA